MSDERAGTQSANPDPSLFRAALDASPHGIMLRAAGDEVYANASWAAMHTATGTDGAHVLPSAAREIHSSGYAFDFAGIPVEVTVAQDVTARRQMEMQLREAQKLEALGRWVGGVVHDFNNLLTAVMLYSDLLAQELAAGSAQANYNDGVRQAAKRGADLIGQLLAFVRHRAPTPAVFSLKAVLHGVRDVLQRMIGEDVELVLNLCDSACNVRMDPVQLEQVLFNLALNSRDAMPNGGKLFIETSERPANGGGEQGPQVALVVRDTGCGMDAEVMSHMFEPFFTTKPKGKGTGLGMSTVQSIMSQNNGATLVESAPGTGTTITLLLPRMDSPAVRNTADAREQGLSTGDETILLVEDDSAVRSAIGTLLVQCGYQVLEADNGLEALRMASGSGQDIDLLLTDLVLPGLSGRELARKLCAIRPRLKTLFISGYGQFGPCSEVQDYFVFEKPFHQHALAEQVRRALESETR